MSLTADHRDQTAALVHGRMDELLRVSGKEAVTMPKRATTLLFGNNKDERRSAVLACYA